MEKKKINKKEETKEIKKVKLNPQVWEIPYNEDLIAQVLYVYSANERKGTVKQKSRGEVSGGGKKPWKQKGTGRARSGSTRSPLWVGGGVTFASHDRNFSRSINKKMARKATCVMLSQRLRESALEFVTTGDDEVKNLRNEKSKTLLVSADEKVAMFVRNSEKVKLVMPNKLNAKHLVSYKKVLVDNDSVKLLEERLSNEK